RPVARDAERSAPVVRDARPGRRWERPRQRPLEPRTDTCVVLARLADRLAEPVGGAAPADRDPAVGRALGAEEEEASIVDEQAVPPAERRPDVLAERLGRDHERVEGQIGEPLAR